MSTQMEAIIRYQQDLFERIAHAFKNLRKADAKNVTVSLLESRLQALEANWSRYGSQHEKLLTSFWNDLSNHDYMTKNMFSLAGETYLQQKTLFLDALHNMKSVAAMPSQETSSLDVKKTHWISWSNEFQPQFRGQYEKWPIFRDLFHSIVGNDASVTQEQKLYYLKSCLKGEARLLVRNLPTTHDNFEQVWKTLTDTYENERLLVNAYFNRFMSLQKLKDESASDFRNLYHCVMSTVNALQSIGRPILENDDLFVHLIVQLLDSRSRREWENLLSGTKYPPSYADLQQFLEQRLHMLDSFQLVVPEFATFSEPSKQQTLHAEKQEDKRSRCSMCQKNHFIMFCELYKEKTAAERKRHVEDNNLCLNCLCKHKLSECNSKKTCSICKERHHTTLHEA